MESERETVYAQFLMLGVMSMFSGIFTRNVAFVETGFTVMMVNFICEKLVK